jgi:hypothetical protein
LRLVDGQLYLERSWEQQEDVRESLLLRSGHGGGAAPFEIDEGRLAAVSGLLFVGAGLSAGEPDLQALAAHCAVRNRVTVLAGGPGTGKTTTIARLLALVSLYEGEVPRISLAAPSGKAAARLQEAVRTEVAGLTMLNPEMRTGLAQIRGVTVHRLLGAMPGRRVSRHAGNPLPSDVVVVDETSMVSLSQMAHLLAAVRPDARLVLVGDPDQLASVDAGAVLADVTSAVEDRGVAVPLVRLRRTWRYGGAIGRGGCHQSRQGNGRARPAVVRRSRRRVRRDAWRRQSHRLRRGQASSRGCHPGGRGSEGGDGRRFTRGAGRDASPPGALCAPQRSSEQGRVEPPDRGMAGDPDPGLRKRGTLRGAASPGDP